MRWSGTAWSVAVRCIASQRKGMIEEKYEVGSPMYHQMLMRHRWLNKTQRIVLTTVDHPDFGSLVARVDLPANVVEIVDAAPAHDLSPEDRTQILHSAEGWERCLPRPYPNNVRWYEEETVFDTWWESYEWVSSDIYNAIGGNQYDGYRTADEKMAAALVYELTQLNTRGNPLFKIFAQREANGDRSYFRVWVERIQHPLNEP